MFLLTDIDQLELAFSPSTQLLLKLVLGLIIFGVALDLRGQDFLRLLKQPLPIILGLLGQLFLLPALSFAFLYAAWALNIAPLPSIALGMLLVAACPGGNMSNFFTHLAKGDTALSVSLSACTTLLAAVSTPLNFMFWGSRLPFAQEQMKTLSLDFLPLFIDVSLMLGLPLLLGLILANFRPNLARRMSPIFKWLSIVFFGLLVVLAFISNIQIFLGYIGAVIFLVILQNALALGLGMGLAKGFRLPWAQQKTLSIELGIQNSGLGLVLCFQYFSGLGGMALIAACWGIWHIISGLGLAFYWSKK
ncbi:bile acid:sodium symporter [Saprospira sp. CCB-QB6]|uniref:bile acid:sodium symporter family protein n=1 Tax=Saprospira sp. CCB-QB6 TaxID=3023936 RepID=UPI00234A71B0|nr:bile acid:sodium symporter [Saprospira sp. CCB-QB6]WCL80148.1 bile acid:sodium symporter [Saprospira sp. CCB-QB6]